MVPNEKVAYGASSSPDGGVDSDCALPPQMVRGKACWPLSPEMQLDPGKFMVLGLKSSF